MKKFMNIITCAIFLFHFISCGMKKEVNESLENDRISNEVTSITGEKVIEEEVTVSGISMSEALSQDGTYIVKTPFKWYSGMGEADDKQIAIEFAQREAYATISRVMSNIVDDEAEKGGIANNGKVQKALKSHWEQISQSILKGCEPLGKVRIQYSQSRKMYSAEAKVGVEGKRYQKLLNNATNFSPQGLNEEEMNDFIEINKSIMEAAKSN